MRKVLFGVGMILAVAAGLAAAGASAGRGADGEADGAAPPQTVEDYLNPELTPEESAAVARGIEAHVEATRRRARAEAGLDEEEPRRTAPPTRSVNDYQQCMASASQAPTAEDREIQSRGCRNLPGAP